MRDWYPPFRTPINITSRSVNREIWVKPRGTDIYKDILNWTRVFLPPHMNMRSFRFIFIKIDRDRSQRLHLRKDRFKKDRSFKTTSGVGIFKIDLFKTDLIKIGLKTSVNGVLNVTYRQRFKFEKLGFCFKNSIHFGEYIQVLY